jgi:hypothetical protein
VKTAGAYVFEHHVLKENGGRIYRSTHSSPRRWFEVSGQLYDSADFKLLNLAFVQN